MHDNIFIQRAGALVCVHFLLNFPNLFIMWITIFKNDFQNSHAESWLKTKLNTSTHSGKIHIWLDGVIGRQEDVADRIWSLVFLKEDSADFENRWHGITTNIIYACPWM